MMQNIQMSGGKPLKYKNLEGANFDKLFWFIEVYVVCPDSTLIIPTRTFIGVFQRNLIWSHPTLIFEEMGSPFKYFCSTLSNSNAKKSGNDASKMLMNSLYDRFWINPIEICDSNRYRILLGKNIMWGT